MNCTYAEREEMLGFRIFVCLPSEYNANSVLQILILIQPPFFFFFETSPCYSYDSIFILKFYYINNYFN